MQSLSRKSLRIAIVCSTCCSLLWVPAEARKKRRVVLKPVQIHDITYDVENVFDPTVPGENIWLFRLANFLHIPTKPSVIRRELLVYPGAWTDLERIAESERNLRRLAFIKEASISQKATADGQVDLTVNTQDSWTTQPQINIASEGGQSSYSVGFEEINLLGYGKDLTYLYKKNVEGNSQILGYNDPQLFNTRFRLATQFQDIPHGNTQDISVIRPFFSLTTRVAGGLPLSHFKALQKVYQDGNQISQNDTEHLSLSPFIGLWVNNDPLNVVRTQLSYRYTEDIYRAQDVTKPGTLPQDKRLSGPIASLTYTESGFIKDTFADRAGRVEDINLGHESAIGMGYVGRSLGATENALPFALNDSFGLGGGGSWFGVISYGMSSRFNMYAHNQTGGRLFNTIYFANGNYYQHLLEDFPMTAVVHAETAYLQNPDTSNVLSLGGDSGLRGFKVNSFTGNKSVLVNVEDRFYYPKEVLHLVYVGGAVFVDAGQVQPQGLAFRRQDFHANIGAGFRFGLSRSSDGTVFRLDLAYAVGPIQQSNRWILSISSAQGFKRTANTYKNFPSPLNTQ